MSGIGVALGDRVFRSATVVASPAAADETIIASVSIPQDIAVGLGILVQGFAAYTVGTDGVSANFRIRRTNVAGTIVKATGATTKVAAQLHTDSILGLDTGGALPNQVYVLTMIVASGSAESTVSAVELVAIVL
jgi:hypothetical protein